MTLSVAKLGHVAAQTTDLDRSVWFFRDVLGMQEVGRDEETVYLRGLRDWEHHTLSLRAGSESGIDHIGWRTHSAADLEAYADLLAEQGLDVRRHEAGSEPGVGERLRFETPNGHPFELYWDVDKPRAPKERRSKLRNRVYSAAVANPIAPQRIDHVHVQDPRPDGHAEWLRETFGMSDNELFEGEDGRLWGWWMSVTPLPHDIGVHRREDIDHPRFHHVSFHVDALHNLWDAADILREHGISPDGGPGRHAITKADFLYVIDPGSDLRIELFAGPGYLNFEPDWEPIVWTREMIGTEGDHQWIGTQYSSRASPYLHNQ